MGCLWLLVEILTCGMVSNRPKGKGTIPRSTSTSYGRAGKMKSVSFNEEEDVSFWR